MSFYSQVFRSVRMATTAAVVIDMIMEEYGDHPIGFVDLIKPMLPPGVIATVGTLALLSELVE